MPYLPVAIIAWSATMAPPRPSMVPPRPIAGWEHRPVTALSNEQITDLRARRGMGLALPAELNGHPGPVHLLGLGDPLRRTKEQRTRVQEFHAAMQADALPPGGRLIT